MRRKSPEMMKKILDFVNEYYRINRRYPTIREIAPKVGTSGATVQRYLQYFKETGVIEYEGYIRSTGQKKKTCTDYFTVPVLGCVSCGVPSMEEENILEYVTLSESLFGTPDKDSKYYILKAVGDSMIDAGIFDGDYILIRKRNNLGIRIGDLVVALDENNGDTLKRYDGIDENGENVVLRYMNKEEYPGQAILIPVGGFTVQGVAIRIIKSLRAACEA